VTGLVISGSRNIFTIKPDGTDDTVECRIKGKALKDGRAFHNPLAPGDRVVFEMDGFGKGLALALEERRNVFTRGRQDPRRNKGCGDGKPQVLAANVDLALCVSSPESPPFRPRFLDRLLAQADASGVEPAVVLNKSDLRADKGVEARMADFLRIGYRAVRVSAKTGFGMDELRALTKGKLSLLVGQSGVGKSSIVNALTGGNIRTNSINEKYDRGVHTTTLASLVALQDGWVIDAPGVRLFTPDRVSADELVMYMREFAPLAGLCYFGLSCSHRTEAGCRIKEAVENGGIYPDRYESFLRLYDELRSTF
jgi:ribosome biogenesis GTPase